MGNIFSNQNDTTEKALLSPLIPSHSEITMMSKKRTNESEIDSIKIKDWFRERNADANFLDHVYTKAFGIPKTFPRIQDKRTEEERQQHIDKMKSLNLKCYLHSPKNLMHDLKGVIFSNILLSSYLHELTGSMKREDLDISFSLYTQCTIEVLPLYKDNNTGHHSLFHMLQQWIFQSGILNTGTHKITRTGFLLAFVGMDSETSKQVVLCHEMLIVAEKLRDSEKISCYCVDNLTRQYYEERPIEFNILHWVHECLYALKNKNIVVYDYHNALPLKIKYDYECMSCARRAVIYAAILNNFANPHIWDEGTSEILFSYHFRNYMTQMNRMLQWFEDREEFWNEKHWIMLPPDDFVEYRYISSRKDNLIVQLRPEIAYVEIIKEDGEEVKMWYCGKGSKVFVEGRHAGNCTTQSQFNFGNR